MRITTVKSSLKLTPDMKRIIVTGNSLIDFPKNRESACIIVTFPNPGSIDDQPKLGFYWGLKNGCALTHKGILTNTH